MIKKKSLLNYCGLLGVAAFLSYTAAVVFSPLAYPGYDWMAQAVSDLSTSIHRRTMVPAVIPKQPEKNRDGPNI